MSVSVSQIGIDRSLDRSIDQSRSPGQSLDQSICVYRCLYKEQHPLKRALTFAVKDPPPDRPLLSSHLIPTIFRALYTCPQRCATSLIFCEYRCREDRRRSSRKLRLASSRSRTRRTRREEFTMLDEYTYEKNNGREKLRRGTRRRGPRKWNVEKVDEDYQPIELDSSNEANAHHVNCLSTTLPVYIYRYINILYIYVHTHICVRVYVICACVSRILVAD